MLCQNCGKNEVNFKYTQIINGVKKQMALCDKCAKSMGLESLDFNMPINFSSFLGDFLNLATNEEVLPSYAKPEILKCDKCGMTYSEFAERGKLGCDKCYDVFSEALTPVLKNIHGSTNHIGRHAKTINKIQAVNKPKQVNKQTEAKKEQVKKDTKKEKIEKLELELKQAIKEERYEDAAKIRDEIKKM